MYPKISIVTPNYNQVEFIEQTIQSVLSQNYPNLEYIIIDGDSNDGSIDIIKKYEHQLTYWISEKDAGIYDALEKGFKKSTGEIMGWINSDDMLHPESLFTLAKIFEQDDIEWIEGLNTIFDTENKIVAIEVPPLRSMKRYANRVAFLNYGYCFIQQESTYWTRNLWNKSGAYISNKYKLAGDFELWSRFFKNATLYHVNTLIGGFRYRGTNQLSVNNVHKYMNECKQIIVTYFNSLSVFNKISILTKRIFFRALLLIPKIGHPWALKLDYSRYSKKNSISIA